MSKKIDNSLAILNNATFDLDDYFTECLNSIRDKGVSFTYSAQAMSTLSGLIDKIKPEPEYKMTINLDRFGLTKNSSKDYILTFTKLMEDDKGETYLDEFKRTIPKGQTEIDITDKPHGNYHVYLSQETSYDGVYIGTVSFGPTTKYFLQGTTFIFTFSDTSNVKAVRLNNAPSSPVYTFPTTGTDKTCILGTFKEYVIGNYNNDLYVQDKAGKWHKFTESINSASVSHPEMYQNGYRYPAVIVFDVDMSKETYTIRAVGCDGNSQT